MAKRIIYLPVLALFLLASLQCRSQAKDVIHGEGNVVTQEISLASLRGIELRFSGDVVLTQGSAQKIVLEGQQNILDNISRRVKNGIWDISYEKDVRNAKDVTVHITLPSLDKLNLSGSGSIHSSSKFTGLEKLEINLAGSGGITLDLAAVETDIDLAGSGNINLSGSSARLDISIAGSGNVEAGDLSSENCEVRIIGSGDATVNVSKELAVNITGSGDVHYSGTASTDTRITGSGEVTKIQQ
jgi:hypothetical protein